MIKKFEWHAKGILLWVVQRSCLRYVPFPYPSVSTCEAWKEQANKMAFKDGCLSQRHLERAAITNAFTAANLADCIWLRNRIGLKVAFVEDPLLEGMMAARSNRGTAAQVRKEAFAEAQRQARVLASQDKLKSAARELLGPKGGLPTLKKDLIKLAAFLEQPINEKATVEELKATLRRLVAQMFLEDSSPKKSSASSSMEKPRPKSAAPRLSEGPLPPPLGQGIGREAYRHTLEAKGQSMREPALLPIPMDVQSVPTESEGHGMTKEEEAEAMIAGLDYLSHQRLAAQYGEEALEYLTAEEINRVLDP